MVIIGAGIVGLATAYRLAARFPGLAIGVLEKEQAIASHQTGRNSGVIHSGIYYKPGSRKAENCIKGRQQLVAFAGEQGVPYQLTGKLIVATSPGQLPRLQRLFENGKRLGIEGIRTLDSPLIHQIEPYCQGIAAVHVPCAGIIDYTRLAHTLADRLCQTGRSNKVLTGHQVIGIEKDGFHKRVITSGGLISTRYLINCAGLWSDLVARMDGIRPAMRIIPFRGDYLRLSPQAAEKVRALIYPVPDPDLPFLGVHLTRRIDGTVEAGPNAVFSFKRQGYSRTAFSWNDTKLALAYLGTWRLFLRHWRYGISEYACALSRKEFLRRVRRLVPAIGPDDLLPGGCGIRAQALGRDGRPIDDFVIERGRDSIHVLNAPSPAATACLAIGEHICELGASLFSL
ncbi:MAG: L-2-hydroxyglutarate oxidase [Sedimentisphaerales bacterium]|nr:L-2-hydroxyglutarate oxidase [Sedimentisphaerales bacterium]